MPKSSHYVCDRRSLHPARHQIADIAEYSQQSALLLDRRRFVEMAARRFSGGQRTTEQPDYFGKRHGIHGFGELITAMLALGASQIFRPLQGQKDLFQILEGDALRTRYGLG